MQIHNTKPKIAVIIQRYGQSVLGGESLCRKVMERLQTVMDITILTSCASDYRTWNNDFSPGWQQETGVTILRFPVRRQRSMLQFKWLTRFVYICQGLYHRGLLFGRLNQAIQRLWLKYQGPYCPELVQYIKQNRNRYDAFIFFTYLYYPTACGILEVGDKAILFPSAHDERPIYLSWYQKVFSAPAALIMQTPEERDFVNKTFATTTKPQRMATMQIPTLSDLPPEEAVDTEDLAQFKTAYQLDDPYIVYTGRIELAKGAKWMFQHFLRFIKETKTPVTLVLLGQSYIKIPRHPQIRYLGFLSEQDKRCAILGAKFFLMPSFFESFSVSLLEALGLGCPALVNGACQVLRGHIERSQGGFTVTTYDEFKTASEILLTDTTHQYGTNGMRYVKQHYTWEKVERAYLELIEDIKQKHNATDTSIIGLAHDNNSKPLANFTS